MTLAQLQGLAGQVGFPDPALAAAVAWAESGGEQTQSRIPDPKGPNGREDSWGLWQVNVPAHPQYDRATLLTPEGNARAAYAISKGGTDWSPWTQYRLGAWRAYYKPGAVSSVHA